MTNSGQRIWFLNRSLPRVRWLMNLTWRQAYRKWGLRAAAEFAERHVGSGLPIGDQWAKVRKIYTAGQRGKSK